MSNLLAIDFDSFFPNKWGDSDYRGRDWMLYDWGHKEAPFFIGPIWWSRAEGFIGNGLPLPDLDGREVGFWDRFKIARGAKLFYADSNACAVNPSLTGTHRVWDSVWLYDAHHDSGYQQPPPGEKDPDLWRVWQVQRLLRESRWSCEDWMVIYRAMGAVLHVRYPAWDAFAMTAEPEPLIEVDRQVDDGSAPDVVFDRVFVCRSGAWVPPWLDIDRRFRQFVAAAPIKAANVLDVQPGSLEDREFDLSQVTENVARAAGFREALKNPDFAKLFEVDEEAGVGPEPMGT